MFIYYNGLKPLTQVVQMNEQAKSILDRIEYLKAKIALAESNKNTGLVDCLSIQLDTCKESLALCLKGL
jgi:hypothetical protein